MTKPLGILLELCKVRIAILSTLSAVTGYVLAARTVDWDALAATAGVFLLACGAAALNQVQERDIDARMERTRNRPLPSGRMSARVALAVSLLLVGEGALILFAFGAEAMVLGLVTVFWYNGVYTPLKRVSAFAAIPGGVVGALPPIIGWACGGGALTDPRIFAVAFFFFVWQIPHFWLLLLRIGDDYRRAGMPTLTDLFSKRQLTRIIFVWMIATAVACMTLPLFGEPSIPWVQVGLAASSLWLGWRATVMLRSDGTMLAFRHINIYALVVISLLSISALIG